MAYSVDFRRKVLSVREKEGLTISEVASRFNIGVGSVIRWNKRLEPFLKRNKPATKIKTCALLEDVRKYPDAYQRERAERLGVSQKGIDHALRRLGITYKKNTSSPKGGCRRTAIIPEQD